MVDLSLLSGLDALHLGNHLTNNLVIVQHRYVILFYFLPWLMIHISCLEAQILQFSYGRGMKALGALSFTLAG